MLHLRHGLIVVGFFGLSLLGLHAVQTMPTQTGGSRAPGPNEIIQEFPTNEPMKSAWKVRWATASGFGLMIQDAWFKKGPSEPWVQVLGEVRLSEMFVPYHSGSPRFWDVSYNFGLVQVGRDEAGPFGKVLGSPPTVVAELRDRGVMWMNIPRGSRRSQALVLWACLDAANYRYINEFSFADDGTISCRVGSTGRNYSSREFEGHMHHGLWRVDLNVAGPDNNSVFIMEHIEPDGDAKSKARTNSRLFAEGKEGFEDWNAEKFTMLSVINTKVKNKRGKQIAYDVVPTRMGSARHHGPDEEACTQHDFWVTRANSKEVYVKKVPKYVADQQSIVDTDVVVWVSTPCHHEPRSEDGEMRGNNFLGATLVAWAGFELRPRNFWDRTPHYPYPAAAPTKR